ncbi:MAG: hypothetical protein KAS66_05355 [Candidatus Omnitrophica bacterium]|nr:hypothetical protein [Candidatus Omnitrophota bacterium]
MRYLIVLLLFFASPALAAIKGEVMQFGIVCIDPSAVSQITTSAETSTQLASEKINQAQVSGVCVVGRFLATLEERIGTGVDADGYTYETWAISKNGVTAYTFILVPPSI